MASHTRGGLLAACPGQCGAGGGSAHLGWAVGVLLMTNAPLIIAPWKESASSLTMAFTCLCLGEKHFTFIHFFFFSQNGCLELQKRLEGESRRNPEERNRKYFGKSLTTTFSFYLVGPRVSLGFSIVEMCERMFGPTQCLLWASSVLFQISAVGSLIHQFSASFLCMNLGSSREPSISRESLGSQGLWGSPKAELAHPSREPHQDSL